jgi:hypothetical protein
MVSYLYLGHTPEELRVRVAGEVWNRWTASEPALAGPTSLGDLATLRGPEADKPLGALVRLAAKDGGDDELAGIALVHQLRPAVLNLMGDFARETHDVEAVVVGAMWESIRSFPWRRRTRAYAANLVRDTRGRVACFLRSGRHVHHRERHVFVLDWVGTQFHGMPYAETTEWEEPVEDLLDLLRWAERSRVLRREDLDLLRDLVAAGYDVSEQETPWMMRGSSSQLAVLRLAQLRGVSEKTIRRHRDRAVNALQRSVDRYLADVA